MFAIIRHWDKSEFKMEIEDPFYATKNTVIANCRISSQAVSPAEEHFNVYFSPKKRTRVFMETIKTIPFLHETD